MLESGFAPCELKINAFVCRTFEFLVIEYLKSKMVLQMCLRTLRSAAPGTSYSGVELIAKARTDCARDGCSSSVDGIIECDEDIVTMVAKSCSSGNRRMNQGLCNLLQQLSCKARDGI